MSERSEYDYVVVGAGFYGAIFAYEAKRRGFSVLVVEERNHIGGNCYTKHDSGVNVHMYGPHIFHTNNKEIWDYVNQFAEFNNFVYRPKAKYESDQTLYSLPINLTTLNQIYGVQTPLEAKSKLEKVRVPMNGVDNLESWCLSQIGPDLYEKLIKGYTTKQWKKDPKDLPSSIIKRLPIRLTHDDNYFDDRYQGIPIGGYTQIFEKLLDGVEVLLNTKCLAKHAFMAKRRVVYTGPIDKFFQYRLGELEYRSLFFQHTKIVGDFQGNAAINYTSARVPYTRVIEHKHFDNPSNETSIITHEFPDDWNIEKIPYYPITTDRNTKLYNQYKELAKEHPRILFGGRLGCYKYLDMHQVIGMALKDVRNEFEPNAITI